MWSRSLLITSTIDFYHLSTIINWKFIIWWFESCSWLNCFLSLYSILCSQSPSKHFEIRSGLRVSSLNLRSFSEHPLHRLLALYCVRWDLWSLRLCSLAISCKILRAFLSTFDSGSFGWLKFELLPATSLCFHLPHFSLTLPSRSLSFGFSFSVWLFIPLFADVRPKIIGWLFETIPFSCCW